MKGGGESRQEESEYPIRLKFNSSSRSSGDFQKLIIFVILLHFMNIISTFFIFVAGSARFCCQRYPGGKTGAFAYARTAQYPE